MKNLLLFLVFACTFSFSCLGSPVPFSPIVRNYSVLDYNAGNENWAVAQDECGVMYFGNNSGLLRYDGSRWKLFPLPTSGIVRAVYVASDRRIYVGSFEEFGYFEQNDLNLLEYHSLKEQVKGFDFHNDEIWTIVEQGGNIIFQSFGSYFIYDGKGTKGVRCPELLLNLFRIGDTLYSQLINGGVCTFAGDKFIPLISRQELGDSDVLAGLPYPGGMLLLTRNSGGYIHTSSGIRPWHTDSDEELKRHTVNRAVMTKDSCYVIGTISNGLYAFSKEGHLLWKENADNQLENNTVLGLYCDMDNNIWTALDNGIAYVRNNSLIYHFEPVRRKVGMVYDVLVRDKDAYIASNQGLYRLEDTRLELVPGLEEQAWTIGEWGGQVLCGHNKGTFQIKGMQARLLSDVRGAMCMRQAQINGEQLLIQGTYTFLNIYKKSAAGEWYFANSVGNFSHMAKNIEVDAHGNIWVQHMRKGLYRLRLDEELKQVTDLKQYDSLSGNQGGNCCLFKVNGRVAFSDGRNFYTYDDMADSIIPYKAMNEQLATLRGIHTVDVMKGDLYWFLSDREAYLVRCTVSDFKVERRIPFSMFGNLPIEGLARMVYDRRNDCSYLCLNNSFARIAADSTGLYKSRQKPSLWVSGFSASDEQTGERIQLPVSGTDEIASAFNNISISLAYPVYNDFALNVRYRLEGLSASGKWAEGLPDLQKEFTRLPFGSYCFRAEVYDENGVISSVDLPFRILRPWYLSYPAVAVYALSGMALLLGLLYGVYVYTKKKKDAVIERQRARHKAEIEQQEKKIMELEKEQLEADLRFKSKELSGVVMTNIAHQEFLNSLKEELQQQKLSGQYTRKNLDKLLSMINQNMVSDEENWNMFQSNFDRIHENFFRNLKEKFPDLTSGDLRLCALLRLNLPTKEIAKLMNISVRGVDAARYRLRKKLGLPPESSLTDFMIAFK